MKIIFTYLVFLLFTIGCKQTNRKPTSVKELIDSATSLTNHYSDTSKFKEAISLLNQAIIIDSNDINTNSKKYFVEFSLGQNFDAERTLQKLIQLRPDSAELYANVGFLQELRNDSLSAKKSFAMAILLYKSTLDTMNKKDPLWMYNWKMSAICTIMAGQEKIIHDFLDENCTTSFDSSFYDIKTLKMSRKELINTFISKYSR